MLGALIGDYIGSQYEFNSSNAKNYYKSKEEFPLFTRLNSFTDDSFMTTAVAESLLNANLDVVDYDSLKKIVVNSMVKWFRAYPDAGYGGYFFSWLQDNDRKPYGSYGNGAAMRISPVGWVARNEEEVKALSRAVTEISHNHPEGIKGAEAVAMCIFLARNGYTKEQIKERVIKDYYPNVDKYDYKELVKNYRMDETCQNSVPQAIYCFLSSNNFEECLRKSIYIGGDSDTIAAISCSIAEAFYKEIPANIADTVIKMMPKKMYSVLLSFKTELTK